MDVFLIRGCMIWIFFPDNYLLLMADTDEIINNKLLTFCTGTPEGERGSDGVSKDD